MSDVITIRDKTFKPYITQQKITEAVTKVAVKINNDFKQEVPLFLVVLNGSFMFAADLLREITIPCELSFVKLASYHGTESGEVKELIGIGESVRGRTVIVVEDIVDTGNTIDVLYTQLKKMEVAGVFVATTFLKPTVYNKEYPIEYRGLEIEDKFVIGYGLDYLGFGRNLKDLYVLE